MINENILGKSFRSCSSFINPRISPLTIKYECPPMFDRSGFTGGKSIRSALKQMAYYRLVEGAIALRVVYDEDALEPKIEVLSPFSLVYVYLDEDGNEITGVKNKYYTGRKYLIVGKKIRNNQIEVYYDERRSDLENQNFIYIPANLRGDKAFGNSQLATLLSPAYNRQKLSRQLGDFLEKRIYPKVFFWMDLTRLFREGVTLKQILEYAKDGAKALKDKIKKIDDPEETQDVLASAPIDFTEITPASKSSLDGIDVILAALEPEIQRASRVPRILLGGPKESSSLNDQDSNVEWVMFSIRTLDAATDIGEAVNLALVPVRRALGIDAFVGIEVVSDNLVTQGIKAENLNLVSEALSRLVQDGIIEANEARMRIKTGTLDFSDIPDEIENPVVVPQPQPQPEGDE